MFKRKNHVGRPSNEELRARKNKKIFIVVFLIAIVFLVVGLFETGTLSNLMGNSVTEYYCENGYVLRGKECIKTIKSKAYSIGDVNRDNNIDITDITYMEKYFRGIQKYDDYQMILADVNLDGKFDVVDVTLLRKYISDMSNGTNSASIYIGQKACTKDSKLKNDECIKEDVIAAKIKQPEKTVEIKYGDVNLDDKIDNSDKELLTNYISNKQGYTLNADQLKAADVNADGKVDAKDRIILTRHLANWPEYKTLPYKGTVTEDTAKKEIIYGDVVANGKVNSADSMYLTRYVLGWKGYTLNDVQKLSADVNLDGKVDKMDSEILSNHVSGWKNYEKLPIRGLVYGDVNSDGKVNKTDSMYLTRYISGNQNYTLNDVQKLSADINLDGKVDKMDSEILSNHVSGWKKYEKLPIRGLIYGDANLDGKISISDVQRVHKAVLGVNNIKLNDLEKINADVNLDGKVDRIDESLLYYHVLNSKIELPYKKAKYGDVNKDGKVTSKDISLLYSYINKKTKLDVEVEINADVYLDYKVDKKDYEILRKYVAKTIKTLPFLPNTSN